MATDDAVSKPRAEAGPAEASSASEVELPHGDALTLRDSCEITHARETSLVVVAGSPASGKTTLVASLMHCFQRGPFADFLYAGSATCIGFDRRCHRSRTRSRAARADTKRTTYQDQRRLLHLKLRHKSLTTPARDVLFTDISGEEYEEIRHSVDACRAFDLFSRADWIVVLIDGQRLANVSERQAARFEAIQLLHCMVDAGQLHAESRLDVLIAKEDLMSGKVAKEFATVTENEVQAKFVGKVGVCRLQRIAARPARFTEEYELGHGLKALLPAWLTRRVPRIDFAKRPDLAGLESEFDKFLERHSPRFIRKLTP